MPTDVCRLCKTEADLQLSHILPAFVYRWLRESSGTGFIRTNQEPNKRVQDGEKRPWLCVSCEQLFSRSEAAFASRLFYPYLENSGAVRQYSGWLMHFCVSVSWRVLLYYRDQGHLTDWESEALRRVDDAEEAWRAYLLGQSANPGAYQQHLLPLDEIASATGELPSNMNRYLLRAIHLDFVRGSKSLITYAKLGRFMILGFVHEPNLGHWKGTKVHAGEGTLGPRQYVLPRGFGEYLSEKAVKMREAIQSVSDRQQEKIDDTFLKSADRIVKSDSFKAMQADLAMFGDDAFSKRPPPKPE